MYVGCGECWDIVSRCCGVELMAGLAGLADAYISDMVVLHLTVGDGFSRLWG